MRLSADLASPNRQSLHPHKGAAETVIFSHPLRQDYPSRAPGSIGFAPISIPPALSMRGVVCHLLILPLANHGAPAVELLAYRLA